MPAHHRLSMYVGSHAGAVSAKVCRPPASHTPFYLEVYAEHADVTLWLPSDFKGTIRTSHPRGAQATTRSRSSSTSSTASSVPPAPRQRNGTHALAQPSLPRAGASASSFAPLAPSSSPSEPRPTIKFSDGFTNRVLPHARVDAAGPADELDDDEREDEVRVCARRVTLRMWDVVLCAPERRGREAWRRMFGCAKAPETVDWDFLVDE
jgi:hypothetical protein